MAAVLASAPAVASHTTAAWLWGLLRTRPSAFHLTATTRRRAKPRPSRAVPPSPAAGSSRPAPPTPAAGSSPAAPPSPAAGPSRGGSSTPVARSRPIHSVHFAPLLARDIDEVDGIPVTSLARTLLDLAAMLSDYRLERALERTEELGLLDLTPIEELLSRAGRHPGVARLRRALDLYREDPAVIRSGVERRFRELVRAAGLPRPAMNFNVAGFELDAYWPSHRFAVELDVFETHGSRAAFERDRLRQEELKLAGVEMVRITGARLRREPRATIERLSLLLEQRLN
jgi:very-short-patch-repair endonuclease